MSEQWPVEIGGSRGVDLQTDLILGVDQAKTATGCWGQPGTTPVAQGLGIEVPVSRYGDRCRAALAGRYSHRSWVGCEIEVLDILVLRG